MRSTLLIISVLLSFIFTPKSFGAVERISQNGSYQLKTALPVTLDNYSTSTLYFYEADTDDNEDEPDGLNKMQGEDHLPLYHHCYSLSFHSFRSQPDSAPSPRLLLALFRSLRI